MCKAVRILGNHVKNTGSRPQSHHHVLVGLWLNFSRLVFCLNLSRLAFDVQLVQSLLLVPGIVGLKEVIGASVNPARNRQILGRPLRFFGLQRLSLLTVVLENIVIKIIFFSFLLIGT